MGNSCCGPREESKAKTTDLKEALIKEGKLLLNREDLLYIKEENSKGNSSHKENMIENEDKEDEIIENSNEFYIQKIEKVKKGDYIKDCLHNSSKNSKKPRKVSKNPSKLNENELKFDEIKGALIVIDEELINKQKKVVGHLIKQMSLNLLQGKSLMNISFPVQVFEPKSVLMRIAGTFGYAPNFLSKAAKTIDVLTQFKFVIAFLISSLHLNISQKKPFNPILGETFQGYIGQSPIFLEQICHHPPISYFYLDGEDYTIHGCFELSASQGLNSVKGRQIGVPKIIFSNKQNKNKTVFRFQTPNALLNNILFGKREFALTDSGYVYCEEKQLFSQINFKIDQKNQLKFDGKIIRSKPGFFQRIESSLKENREIRMKTLDFSEDIEEILSVIEGDWRSHLLIDGEKYWDIREDWAYSLKNMKSPLPSDSIFRLDSLYLAINNEETAQIEKENLENLQRNDRKLRDLAGNNIEEN